MGVDSGWRGRVGRWVVGGLVVVGAAGCASVGEREGWGEAVELLGMVELAQGLEVEGTRVGGLSALAWEAGEGRWWAVSDDGGLHGPPRVYELRIDVGDGRLVAGDVAVVGVTRLADVGGLAFAPGTVDPEGLALSGRGTFFVSSEGNVAAGAAPWVREVGRDGVTVREVALPDHVLPGPGRGVRHNFAFESLAVTPGGTTLITATEAALTQDGPAAGFQVPTRARVLRFAAAGGELLSESVYQVDAPEAPAVPAEATIHGGLVDLLALSEDRLLALERTWIPGVGMTLRLYETRLEGSEEVTGDPRLPEGVRPLPKRLLLDFAGLGIRLDNVEGMALGPALPDGRRSLVMVSDDNFADHQRTQVLLFAFAEEALGAPPAGLGVADLQGAGHVSPLLGRRVAAVAGVVTAVVAADGGGARELWLQDPTGDGDPATSEGMHVTGGRPVPFPVAPGDEVRVSGRVAEIGREGELPTTSLVTDGAAGLRVVARGGALPPPVVLGAGGVCPPRPVIDDDGLQRFEPGSDGIDFWEALEGMRVRLDEPLVVGPTTRHGEIALVAAACAPAAPRTGRGGLLVGPDDFHPERLIADDVLVPDPPQVAVGDRFAGPVEGVVHASFGNYKLLNPAPLPAVEPARPPAGADGPAGAPGDLTVATFNVENLSAVDPEGKFAALARALVAGLGSPAVVALQEVRDDSGPADDGTVSSGGTLDRLVAAVAAAGGPAYLWRQVDPEDGADGGAPGGNIRVAFLLDPARVTPVDRGAAGPADATAVVAGPGGPRLTLSPGRVAPGHPAFTGAGHDGWDGSRKPLALEAGFAGRPLFLVALHLASKGGDDPLFGIHQPPRRPSEEQRGEQAAAVAGFVRELLAADPDARVVVLGDLNEFPFRPPVRRLEAAGLVNLMATLPAAEAYTYVYEGNSQILDHVLASPALAAAGARAHVVHLHADQPAGRRASDHDPVVARFPGPGPATP